MYDSRAGPGVPLLGICVGDESAAPALRTPVRQAPTMLFPPERRHCLGRYGKAAGSYSSSRRLCCDDCSQLGVMGGRSNWSRIEQRRLMRRQRVEHVKGGPTFTTTLNKPPPRRLSKAELREQAEAAFRAWREGQTSKGK